MYDSSESFPVRNMLSSLRDYFLTEEYRGLIESFVTWCNDSHLKLSISKTNELMVDYQRNRRPPVLVVIQGEEAKRVDSYKYFGVQINKL